MYVCMYVLYNVLCSISLQVSFPDPHTHVRSFCLLLACRKWKR